MRIHVQFWSYFADLAGTGSFELEVPPGARIAAAIDAIEQQFPPLAAARRCALVAVGLDYAPPDQELHEGDELSLFPPVQGG